MFGDLAYRFKNLHNLMALKYHCVGAFCIQGDNPQPKIDILKNQFSQDISISKSCLGRWWSGLVGGGVDW